MFNQKGTPMTQSPTPSTRSTTIYDWIRRCLLYLAILLLAAAAVTPGVLRLFYRADAQVALGHAKSVRMAIQVAATERYGQNRIFSDTSSKGGVAEGIYEEILELSAAPGDFQVLRTGTDGYTLKEFVYREGACTVWYTADPSNYQVYHEEHMTGVSTDALPASEE